MKKRWLFSLLTLCALALCLSSCLKDGATGELKDEPKDETVDHRSLSCTEYDDFLPYRFGEEDGAYALSLHLPADWEAVPDEEGIGYFMNGRQVARVQADDAPDEDYVCVEKTLLGDEGMDIDVCVERKGTGASAVYRRVVRIWLLAE
ncbi:MAG: hypothetical protein J6R89_02125, partial [Clostridia bacterium]|nr:hypothetical protein [Clostridia bacterium]